MESRPVEHKLKEIIVPGAAAILFLMLCGLHLTGLFSDESRAVLSWFLDLPLRALLLIALADGISALRSPCERRFWTLMLAAFSTWFIADMAFQSGGDRPILLGILEDGAFLLFYPLLMLAVEQRPARYHWPLREWGSRMLCGISGFLLLVWSYFYAVVLPLIYVPDVFLSEAPSYVFFAIADVIFLVIFLVRTLSRTGRWRVIYGLLAAAMFGWAVTDLLDALALIGFDVIGYGTPLDVVWPLPYFFVIAAAVYRNRSSKNVAPVPATTAHGSTLVATAYLYTAGISVIHLVVFKSGWLPELEVQRELTVVAGTAILLTIAIAIHIREIRRRQLIREPRIIVFEDEIQLDQRMESLGRLAGGIAHDFNNLLMVLQSQVDSRSDQLRTLPDGPAFVSELETVVRRGSDLSHQLLAFGRKQVTRVEVVNPRVVVDDAKNLIRRTLGAHIDVEIDLEPDVWNVAIDPGQLTQILINLALNARSAMPDGGSLLIRVGNVALDEGSEDGMQTRQFVQFEIRDTGQGMDERSRSRVFEPFFSNRRGDNGAGLGLAVVYGIVKQNDGLIACESTEGIGTTFRIHLPRVDGVEGPPPAVDSVAPSSIEGNETILFAEDENDVRTPVAQYLREAGYRVLEASDGVEAMEVAEAHSGAIHLLVSDIVMPRVGGPELADRLTASRANLKVLFVTGYAQDLSVNGLEISAKNVLQKPYSLMTLVATIRSILDND